MSQTIRKLEKGVLQQNANWTFEISAETKLVQPKLNYWEVNDDFGFFLMICKN